jgi:hypothetical protein
VERIVQLALGQLSPAKKTAEAGESIGVYQGFQWIEHSGLQLVGYRNASADSKTGNGTQKRGQEIAIKPGPFPSREEIEKMTPEAVQKLARSVYFDLEQLYVDVTLQSNNVADEQTRLNLHINAVDRMGMSKETAWERMGWPNFKMNQTQRGREITAEADQQARAQKILGMAQLQIERESMAMQQQAQAEQQQAAMQQQQSLQNQQNQMNSGSQFANLQGQDMRAGGQSAAQVAPFETREQVTGQTSNGTEMV